MAQVTVTLDVPENSLLAKAVALGEALVLERVVLIGNANAPGAAVHFQQTFDAVASDKVTVTP